VLFYSVHFVKEREKRKHFLALFRQARHILRKETHKEKKSNHPPTGNNCHQHLTVHQNISSSLFLVQKLESRVTTAAVTNDTHSKRAKDILSTEAQ
jgi:hypothetical protein